MHVLERPRIVNDLTRRDALFGAAALAVLIGCGSEDSDSSAPHGGGYPRTLQTHHGDVTITGRPERVVAIGTPDPAVAAGVVPIGITRDPYSSDGIPPWLTQTFRGRDVTLLEETDGLQYERIAGLEPDLIVSTDRLVTGPEWDRLSRIAPTVTYVGEGPYVGNPWQAQTRLVAEALAGTEAAERTIRVLEARLRAVRDSHAWRGKTFTFSNYYQALFYVLSDPHDAGVALLSSFGFVLSPATGDAPLDDMGALSPESVPLLDADVMIVLCEQSSEAELRARPLVARTRAATENRLVIVEPAVGYAMRLPGAFNLGWLLDGLVARLEGALGR